MPSKPTANSIQNRLQRLICESQAVKAIIKSDYCYAIGVSDFKGIFTTAGVIFKKSGKKGAKAPIHSSTKPIVGPDQVAADQVAADQVAADQVAADQVAADQVAADQVATDQVAPDQVAPDQVAPDQVAPDQVAPDQVAPDQVAPDQVAPDQVAPDQVAPDQVEPDQVEPVQVEPVHVASTDLDAQPEIGDNCPPPDKNGPDRIRNRNAVLGSRGGEAFTTPHGAGADDRRIARINAILGGYPELKDSQTPSRRDLKAQEDRFLGKPSGEVLSDFAAFYSLLPFETAERLNHCVAIVFDFPEILKRCDALSRLLRVFQIMARLKGFKKSWNDAARKNAERRISELNKNL